MKIFPHTKKLQAIFISFFILLPFFYCVYKVISGSLNVFQKQRSTQKIFCMILTKKSNIENKIRTVHAAWASQCDDYAFFTAIPDKYTKNIKTNQNERIEILVNDVKVVQPKGLNLTNDKYEELTKKVLLSFQDIYNRNSSFDWYIKADDDTYMMMDNLREFLEDKNPNAPVTYGYRFDDTYVMFGYNSGGAGYVLSREATHRLVTAVNRNFTVCSDSGIEDLDMGDCLRALHVNPEDTIDEFNKERFHFGSFESHFFKDFKEENWEYLLPMFPIRNVTNTIFQICNNNCDYLFVV